MSIDTMYETPDIIELGDFTTETGEFIGPCPETILPLEDHSCP
ncbi:hypothetical protein [Nocardiopsis rhodophaea]